MSYDFTTLDPNDFEALVGDLLSYEWGATLELFKPGKDTGIDLRHSRVHEGDVTTIVQCKRYAPHKFLELLRSIKNEKKNLKRLDPERYVLVTSVALSPANKDKLVAALSPWCTSPSDIYGPDELNSLLRKFPEIERAHFKLWISSTAVLERILHSKIFAVTDNAIESTKSQLSKLVVHEGLNKALKILQDHHHLLIVGNPGIGKTTLARMLMCHYMREGFEPVWVVSNIDDAWAVIHSIKDDKKIIVVYDDFLGRLQFNSERFRKNEDHSLMQFLDKVARSSNLRFILTTREYILEDAKQVHGVFDSRANEIFKYTLSLAEYSKAHRAQILFNHLYFSDLPDSRLQKLVKERTYNHFINHRYFNPRLIESISKNANSRTLSDDDYILFVQKEFNDPSKTWEHSFKYEISSLARKILTIVWSYGEAAELASLRLSVSKVYSQKTSEDFTIEFDTALRQLDGNFIECNRLQGFYAKSQYFEVVQFQNPSVEEFIQKWMESDPIKLLEIIEATVSMRQIEVLAAQMRKLEEHELSQTDFWLKLREKAIAFEHIKSGFIIYHYVDYWGTTGQLKWYDEPLNSARITKELLKLEARLKINDERNVALKKRVLTETGWAKHLADITNNDSTLQAATLQGWIVKSDWNKKEKELSEKLLRKVILTKLSNSDQHVDLEPLHQLALSATLIKKTLPKKHVNAFINAINIAVQTLVENLDDANDLLSKEYEIKMIEKILGQKLTTLTKKIRKRAKELEVYSSDQAHDDPEEQRYKSLFENEIDIDKLFSGLVDR